MKVRATYDRGAPCPASHEVVIFWEADESGPLKQSGQLPSYTKEAQIFNRLGRRSTILLKDLPPGMDFTAEGSGLQTPANALELFSLDRRL